MKPTTAAATVMLMVLAPSVSLGADYTLRVGDTGKRDYYCTLTAILENGSDVPLTEISGFFYAYVGEEQVGRSKGAWFMNIAPGGRAEAEFETPNAPCQEVDRYVFVLGACRIGATFEDRADCTNLLDGQAPIEIDSLR